MLRTKLFRKHLPNFMFEVTIIIVGILLSFMISNWVQGRKDYRKQREYLQQINKDLKIDLQGLNSGLEMRSNQLDFVSTTLRAINDQKEQVDLASVTRGFALLVSTVSFTTNNVTFRSLESIGQLGLIKNQEIVAKIVSLYANAYARLSVNNDDVTEFRNNILLPYIIKSADVNGAVNRQDFSLMLEVLSDREFHNHLAYNQIRLFSAQGAYQQVIRKVEDLIKLLEQELGK
jgi:type II secretory pathway pseudopilin PulG